MTTRWYLTNSEASYRPSALQGTYNDSSLSANIFEMGLTKLGANTSAAVAETSTTNNYKVLLARWVSSPLVGGSITTADSITVTMARQEDNASANDTVYITVWVTTGNSDIVRGTLIVPFVGATEFATTMTAFSFTLTYDNNVSVSRGDRIVMEIGYNAANTSATSFTGTIRYGGTAVTDLATSGTTGVTTNSPWIEFNTTIDAVVAPVIAAPPFTPPNRRRIGALLQM